MQITIMSEYFVLLILKLISFLAKRRGRVQPARQILRMIQTETHQNTEIIFCQWNRNDLLAVESSTIREGEQ